MFGLGDQGDLSVSYGSGAVAAQMVSDKFCLAKDSGCTDMNFLMSTEESEVFATLGADGVLGLSLPDLSVSGQYNVLSALQQKGALPANVFAFTLGDDKARSEVTFGGYRKEHIDGKMVWVHNVENDGYWTIAVKARHGKDEVAGTQAILDSGSSVIAAPPDVVKKLKATACDEAVDLHFEVDGANLRLPVHRYRPTCEQLLVVPMSEAATSDTDDAQPNTWVLGEPFLRHYTAVFDFDARKIGLGKSKELQASFLRSSFSTDDGLVSIPLTRRGPVHSKE